MFDKKIGDQQCSVFYRVNARMVICCAVVSGVMLPWKSYANAEEFATVHIGDTANVNVHAYSQPRAVQNMDTSAVVEANDKESIPIDTDPDLSDVVQLDTSKEDQHSQLDLAGSGDMQSLDVVDTGSSVKFPHANDRVEKGYQPLVTGVSVKLPVTDTADAHSQVGDADSQLEDASNDAASEESAGLPYAVVLALLALIGLVPVARRTDHHHV